MKAWIYKAIVIALFAIVLTIMFYQGWLVTQEWIKNGACNGMHCE